MNLNDDRTRDIFRLIVEEYLKYGIPVGSQTISNSLKTSLSSATIRNVMSDLVDADLLFSPHTSAGRQPTEQGLRLYVDTLMKIDDISSQRLQIEQQLNPNSTNIYDGASNLLSGLSSCIGIVIAPKMNKPIKKIEFLKLEPYKILCILITSDGMVENRVVTVTEDASKSELEQVSHFLNDRMTGKTLPELNEILLNEKKKHQDRLNNLASLLINEGIIHPLSSADDGHIFINGQSRLLDSPEAQSRIEEMKSLFALLEEKQSMLTIMDAMEQGEGVQIFIGSENPVFERPAWTTIISAYHDKSGRIIGATGVIGPTRLNYGKIIPIVDYTSLVVEKLLGKNSSY